jgi:hypothetical protein
MAAWLRMVHAAWRFYEILLLTAHMACHVAQVAHMAHMAVWHGGMAMYGPYGMEAWLLKAHMACHRKCVDRMAWRHDFAWPRFAMAREGRDTASSTKPDSSQVVKAKLLPPRPLLLLKVRSPDRHPAAPQNLCVVAWHSPSHSPR